MSGMLRALLSLAGEAVASLSAEEWARPFSGTTAINRFLHSLPHCSFEHGCHSLPFEDDTNYMASKKGAETWLQTILVLSFVPACVFILVMLFDVAARCFCRCCGCGSRKRVRNSDGSMGPPRGTRCCNPCTEECGADDEGEDEADDEEPGVFRTPAERLASGGGHYGSSGYSSRVASHAVARRGGTAGQTSDAFVLMHDPHNPFNRTNSGRSLALSQGRDFNAAEAEGRPIGAAADRDEEEHRLAKVNPDRSWKCRMVLAVILSIIALAALCASLWLVARGHASMNEVRTDIVSAQRYFSVELHDQYVVGALQGDLAATQAALLAVESAALNLSRPLSAEQARLVHSTATNYGLVCSDVLGPFAQRLANESRHGDDVRRFLDELERSRQWTSYTIFGTTVAFTVVALLVHLCTRRRRCLSLSINSFFAVLLILSFLLAAAGVSFSTGLGDACMAPVSYLRSALNSTALLPKDASAYDRAEAATLEFYIDCQQEADPASPDQPLPTWPSNPLNKEFLGPAVSLLRSSSVGGGLASVEEFISTNRTDLLAQGVALAAVNVTTFDDVDALQARLGCAQVHNTLMSALDNTCHGLVENVWVAAALQFGACILLFIVRLLLLMRRRSRHSLLEPDADGTTGGAGVASTTAEPFLVGLGEGKDNDEHEGQPHAAVNAASLHSVTAFRTYARA